jgi:DNA-binding transcriptional ArsR family regulator
MNSNKLTDQLAKSNSKALQRFTEINTKEDILRYVNGGGNIKELKDHLYIALKANLVLIDKMINDESQYNILKYGANEYEKTFELHNFLLECATEQNPIEHNKELLNDNRRDQYTINREIILKLYKDYIISNGTLPTITHISAKTGLSRQTITKHFKEIRNDHYLQDIIDGSYILVDSVLAKLFALGIETGNVNALKTFLDWHKDKSARIMYKNYIQVNNLILTEEDIKALPQESVIEIENFIKKFKPLKIQGGETKSMI